MPNVIQAPENTRRAHKVFIDWINSLMNHYVSSFYDEAIKNFIQLCFIQKHYSTIIEIYSIDGTKLIGFLSILPTDKQNPIMMYHDIDTGLPSCYNDTDVSGMFKFGKDGSLEEFEENVVAYMKDRYNDNVNEVFLSFRDLYGINYPMLSIRNPEGATIGSGILDVDYKGYSGSSYQLRNMPVEAYPLLKITNLTKSKLQFSVPILENLDILYILPPEGIIFVPRTERSEYYLSTLASAYSVEIHAV